MLCYYMYAYIKTHNSDSHRNSISHGQVKYRMMGYIQSRNFHTDTGKLTFESFIFVYVPYSNNVLYSNN